MREVGDPAGSLAANEAPLALWIAVADARPSVNQSQLDVANGYNKIGQVLRIMGRTSEALEFYVRSLEIMEGRLRPTRATETRERLLEALKSFCATQLAGVKTAEAVVAERRDRRWAATLFERAALLPGLVLRDARRDGRRSGLEAVERGRAGDPRAGGVHATCIMLMMDMALPPDASAPVR